jgi:hypothetical protein
MYSEGNSLEYSLGGEESHNRQYRIHLNSKCFLVSLSEWKGMGIGQQQ